MKEPIHNPFFLLGLLVILALSIPWYLAQGSIEPIIFGFPYWAVITFMMTLILSAFLHWVINTQWEDND